MEEVADAEGVTITEFDAQFDAALQTTQLQDVIASGSYDGVVVAAINGPGLIPEIEEAIAAGLQVVVLNQVLGDDLTTPDPQVDGVAASVLAPPYRSGERLGALAVEACADIDPCRVVYLYGIKGTPLDDALREGFDAAIADSANIEVVAEGEGQYLGPEGGINAIQDIMQAEPEFDVVVGADQSIQGVETVLERRGHARRRGADRPRRLDAGHRRRCRRHVVRRRHGGARDRGAPGDGGDDRRAARRHDDRRRRPAVRPARRRPDHDGQRRGVHSRVGGLTPVAEVVGVGKRFGATQALHDVSVAFRRGVVHALVGENGAGKSTLGRVLTGVVAPDEGDVVVAGQVVRLRSPRHALTHGLVGIAQELSLVPATTVLDNVMLGTESTRAGFVDRRAQRARFAEIEAHYGFELDPDAVVRDLNVAAQQRVELLRALGRRAALVVMDEPTARLTMGEAMALRGVIRMLAAEGTAIVYVSHFLDEVLAVSDEVTVMRDGRVVRTGPAAAETPESLLEGMVGRTIGSTFPPKVPVPPDAPVRLAVDGLARPGEFGPVSFSVRAGEIVGLAGLVGAGRSELAHAVVGSTKAAIRQRRRRR